MQIAIEHRTVYTYAEPTLRILQMLRVTPCSFTGQTVLDWRVDVDCDARLREGRDGYGNLTHMLYVDQPVTRLSVEVSGRVLTEDQAGIVRGLPGDLPPLVFLRSTPLSAIGPTLQAFRDEIESKGGQTIDKLHRLNGEILSRLAFDSSATTAETTAEDAYSASQGVCQDFAHIFISVARQLGIPARYISGHLLRRDGESLQAASHAWAEAYVEDLGWVAFDPAHGVSTDENYVRVACGLDYREASPVVGTRAGGGVEKLDVEVEVRSSRNQSQVQTQS